MTRITLCVEALEAQLSGIGRYTWELCKGLQATPEVSAHYLKGNLLIHDPACLLDGAPVARPGVMRRWLDKRTVRASLVHGPNYFLPDFVESGLITVHDLSVFRFPETHPIERVRAFERNFIGSMSRAVHIITDTQTIRAELIETYGLAPDMVTSVPLGVSPSFSPRSSVKTNEVLERWGLQAGGYGLCVSTLEPRKKISELLFAWRALPRGLRDAFPLVLCGGSGWRNEELLAQVAVGVAEGWLVHLGFVDEALLPDLYGGAALFVYPSIYEGFGLPLIEAMASGIPALASKRSCLPEVGGNAARYFDPDDPGGFVEALEAGLTDGRWREDAIRRGLKRAKEFTWRRCIEETVAIYRKTA